MSGDYARVPHMRTKGARGVIAIGSAMNGGGDPTKREKDDYYPTPDEVTMALLAREKFVGPIHECACGDGMMAKVIRGYTHSDPIATDLVFRGYGTGGSDFLQQSLALAPNIITNPPFDLATEFIVKGWSFPETEKMAFVLPANFWHAAGRRQMFEVTHRPKVVYALTWRPDFQGLGRPTVNCIWTVWERAYSGPTLYELLPNPVPKLRRAKKIKS